MKKLRAIAGTLWWVFRAFVYLLGMLAVMMFVLSFTNVPWRTYLWLASDPYDLGADPEYIVILGGGGIPSESGLMRSYYGASAAKDYYRAAKVILALPDEPEEEESSLDRMRDELILRGVEPERIMLEDKGVNTRQQVLIIAAKLGDDFAERPVLVVTSPEHMKRSLLTFRKAGFHRVAAWSAFDVAVDYDMSYQEEDDDGNWRVSPDAGASPVLRYTVWNSLSYSLDALREFVAITYYWMRDWI